MYIENYYMSKNKLNYYDGRKIIEKYLKDIEAHNTFLNFNGFLAFLDNNDLLDINKIKEFLESEEKI